MSPVKVIFLPGNGAGRPAKEWFWFPQVEQDLKKAGIKTLLENFPDAKLARSSYWLPFVRDTLKADHNTVLVGHSSGAIAALRFAEKYPILGSVLVGSYYTDLGMESEKASGYFDTPWNWEAITRNQQWILQFASIDDPWIPIDEPRYVHEKTGSEYHEFTNKGHFGGDYDKTDFPELTQALLTKLSSTKGRRK